MHAILSQYIEDLSHEFDIQNESESKLFEYFCNYVITSKEGANKFLI